MTRTLRLTPRGHLQFVPKPDAPSIGDALEKRLDESFARGVGHGLVALGAGEPTTALPPVLAFFRDFAGRYVTAMTAIPEGGEIAVCAPDEDWLGRLCFDAPPMTGVEYLSSTILENLWEEIGAAIKEEIESSGLSLQAYLRSRHPGWNLVGRVHFNLAENRKDPDHPFAFLATYTSRLSAHGKAQHLPLSQALSEFSGGKGMPSFYPCFCRSRRRPRDVIGCLPWLLRTRSTILSAGRFPRPFVF